MTVWGGGGGGMTDVDIRSLRVTYSRTPLIDGQKFGVNLLILFCFPVLL